VSAPERAQTVRSSAAPENGNSQKALDFPKRALKSSLT
jgi:hypothetical protein